MRLGGEYLRPTPEFAVTTARIESIHQWLQVQNKISQESLRGSNGDNSLKIGELDIDDEVLTALQTIIVFDPDEARYEIKTGIILTDTNNTHSSMADHGNIIVQIMNLTADDGEKKKEVKAFAKTLQDKVSLQDYRVEYRNNSTDFTIHKSNSSYDPEGEDEKSFQFHAIAHPMQTIYCLHYNGAQDEPAETFERDFVAYADLLKQTVDTIYDTNHQRSPHKTLELAPPKNIDRQIKQLERMLSMEKRMRSATGMDEDELDDEISQNILMSVRPTETFESVGGQDKAKEELQTVVYALTNPEIFTEEGTYPPRGVLLYGPAGTGKTLLAKALAHEAQADFYNVQLADIVQPLFGKSERLLAQVFEQARTKEAAVIFIDELDTLAPSRDSSHSVSRGMVSTILTNLDGIEERGNIIIVGATNRLEAIDKPLTRPGRFDLLIEVGLPNEKERKKIFDIHMRKAEARAKRALFVTELDITTLIQKTNQFSGADIEEVIRRVLNENVKLRMSGSSSRSVSTESVLAAIENYEPTRKAKQKIGFDIYHTR